MAKRKRKSGVTLIRMPPELHTQLAGVAEALNVGLNGLLVTTLEEALPGLLARAERAAVERKRIAEAFAKVREILAKHPKATDVFYEPEWSDLLELWQRDQEAERY